MELYLTFKQPDDKELENAPSMVEIDFFRELINVADESEVSELATDLGLEDDAFAFLLNGEDSVGGDYDLSEEEIEAMKEEYGEGFTGEYTPIYYSASKTLNSMKVFFEKNEQFSNYKDEVISFLEFCIENELEITTYSGF
jgi:hypothetical protein